MTLAQRIIAHAQKLGFTSAAIIPAQTIPDADLLLDWLHEGRHGEMTWMENHGALRKNPAVLEPGTRSVIALTTSYASPTDLLPGGLRIARYAHNDDYHDVLRTRMRQLAAFIHAETGASVAARPAVDSAPLLERGLAAQAGLGWIGKNSLLIHRQHGSMVLLSELLIDIHIDHLDPEPYPNRCGSCSRCIDACPTNAIVAPHIIDARRCISYLTIELKNPIPRHLRHLIGDHLFGCDICQDVCPWNSRLNPNQDPAFAPRPELAHLTLTQLIQMTQEQFSTTFKGSPIKRTRRRGLLRNAAVVLGNTGSAEVVPLLIERLDLESEEMVRGHIAWALGRIRTPQALDALALAANHEQDPYVLDEIHYALEAM